jgi:hypothetical protein
MSISFPPTGSLSTYLERVRVKVNEPPAASTTEEAEDTEKIGHRGIETSEILCVSVAVIHCELVLAL